MCQIFKTKILHFLKREHKLSNCASNDSQFAIWIFISRRTRSMTLEMTRFPMWCSWRLSFFLSLSRYTIRNFMRNAPGPMYLTCSWAPPETYITPQMQRIIVHRYARELSCCKDDTLCPQREILCSLAVRGWRRSGAFLHYQSIKPLVWQWTTFW